MAKKAKALHEKRKVTFQELGALYAVRGMLADGVLKHEPSRLCIDAQHLINMAVAGKQEGCGSVGCIGGNMAFVMGISAICYVGGPDAKHHPSLFLGDGLSTNDGRFYQSGCSRSLLPLFFPNRKGGYSWGRINAMQMVAAIDNWLENGHPRWQQIFQG